MLAHCKDMAVSYTGLLLTMDTFPQVGQRLNAPHRAHEQRQWRRPDLSQAWTIGDEWPRLGVWGPAARASSAQL